MHQTINEYCIVYLLVIHSEQELLKSHPGCRAMSDEHPPIKGDDEGGCNGLMIETESVDGFGGETEVAEAVSASEPPPPPPPPPPVPNNGTVHLYQYTPMSSQCVFMAKFILMTTATRVKRL